MERKIKDADLLAQIGAEAESKNQFIRALEYYREAGQIYYSLSVSSANKELKKKLRGKSDTILKRGNEMKQKLRQEDIKKAIATRKSEVTNTKTEFTLVPACADLFARIGFEFYRQVSDKNSSAGRKILLKSAINAHIAEVEIKKTVNYF